ncbi:PTS sugar transporter subunit IIA [Xylella fastidiosa subsp. multiplex]|uniref:PTS sugar transporter subunit IIA n=1 Tax=Xylella fastidiosa TaxID=2371 RepID=UPI002361473C|nr:PTS sugar transporter subunit IIA [Xylella fastidiosa]MDD0926587.1 PTS sugar transporter subunit IIA [Xylella fastidiosa subsp. multiplex]
MACGILLITHPGIGQALLRVATALLQQLPLKIEAFEVPLDVDLDTLLPHASAAMHRVNNGEGVLIMTDLYGASPSNLAHRLAQLDTPVRRVSALSLPMLLRVMNHPEQNLQDLPATAAAATRNGAIIDDA